MLKNLFKDNWRWLARIGFDYVAKHLLGRIRLANTFFANLLEEGIVMGDESIDVLTDDDPNNAAQLRRIVQAHYENLITLTVAGAVTEIDDDAARLRIIAILQDTCNTLRETVARNATA